MSTDGEKPKTAEEVTDPEVDEELSTLLDSALNEFQVKPKASGKAPDVCEVSAIASGGVVGATSSGLTEDPDVPDLTPNSFEHNLNTDFAKFDEMFSPLINSDPQLKEHWTRLT
ncbi:unnamed protein product, partial [Medioppia subpectinata]